MARVLSSQEAEEKRSAIVAAYDSLIESGKISADKEQKKIADKLSILAKKLEKYRQKFHHGLISRLFRKRKASDINSLYIYGGVGRGKSMLMDLFFENVTVIRKKRVHFHAFMLDVHNRIHLSKKTSGRGELIKRIAAEIADENWLICFDEFQVQDIADAMILGRLFEELFNQGVVIVATSNRHPDELYKDGLQRQRFLPFIDIFKKKLDIIELAGSEDYRLKHLKSLATIFFTPLGKKAETFIKNSFTELTGGAKPETRIISVNGRKLKALRTHGKTVWFNFSELCEQALGASDYIEIAREFSTVLLANLPQMNSEKRNEAKRFVTLIDELYEHKVKLICTAEVPPEELYKKGDGSFEFERTASRLIEMQSEDYLKTGHIA